MTGSSVPAEEEGSPVPRWRAGKMLPSIRGDSFSLPPGLGLWGPDRTLVCSIPPHLILLGPLCPRSNVGQCAPRVSLQAGRAGWEGSLAITTSGPGVPPRACVRVPHGCPVWTLLWACSAQTQAALGASQGTTHVPRDQL